MRRPVSGGVFSSRATGPVNVTVTWPMSLPELSVTKNVRGEVGRLSDRPRPERLYDGSGLGRRGLRRLQQTQQ